MNLKSATATAVSLTESGDTLPTGTGELTVTGAATFTANTSTESGTGTTLMEGGASIAASNSLSLTVSRTLELQGMSTVTGTTGGGTIALGTAGTLKIDSGATFDEASGGTIATDLTIAGTTGMVANDGTFEKTVGTGATIINAAFVNTGISGNVAHVQVATGTLDFTSSATESDTFTSYSGSGTIEFAGGTRTLDNNSGITTSNVEVAGAMVTDNGTYNVSGSTTVSSGALNLDGTVIGLGAVSVSGGSLSLASASGTLSSSSSVSLTSNGTTLALGSENLTTGTFTQQRGILSGNGTLTVTGSATWVGGVPDVETGAGETILQGTSTLTSIIDLDGGREISNQGTATWTGGDNITLGYNGASQGSSAGGGPSTMHRSGRSRSKAAATKRSTSRRARRNSVTRALSPSP